MQPSPSNNPSSSNNQPNQEFEILSKVAKEAAAIYDRYFLSSTSLSLFEVDLTPQSDLIRIISLFSNVFQRHHASFLQPNEIEQKQRTFVNFSKLVTVLSQVMPDFERDLIAHSHMVLPTLCISAHLAIMSLNARNVTRIPISEHTTLSVRLTRYPTLTPIRVVKASFLSRFVAFRANVLKVGPIRPLILGMYFTCPNCSAEEFVMLNEGRYMDPKPICQCPTQFKGGLVPDRNRVLSIDSQAIRIQEILVGAEQSNPQTDPDDDDSDSRSDSRTLIPRSFDCELTRDLCDCCLPGDVVVISGVIKSASVDPASRSGAPRKTRQKDLALYLDVHSLSTSNRARSSISKLAHIDLDAHYEEIRAVVESRNHSVFKTLVHSLCPGIFGHELVKAGMILALFGGNSQLNSSQRHNSHFLVVGDPGMGKSQMLKAVNGVSPRGVLVTGNTSSASGLTVALVRDGGSDGDFSIEAGALVLGDEGTTCIDEFDKLASNQHASLLEAMEQQTISITKAATVVTLPTRTSVFAAANPVGGHYDRSKTVAENIKLSGPLLSRFDLIFILVDEPDEVRDEALSSHIIQLRQKNRPRSSLYDDDVVPFTPSSSSNPSSLLSKMMWNPAKDGPLRTLSPALLRYYIAYCRRYCHPLWTNEAKSVLYQEYLRLRRSANDGVSGGSPITTRQLNSMVRLAEARAKCDMRLTVTESDARDVIELMGESLKQIYCDESGVTDFRRGAAGASGMSKAKDVKRLYQIMVRRANERTNDLFSRHEIKSIAQECGIGSGIHVDALIENLNQHNFILKGPGDTYRLQQ